MRRISRRRNYATAAVFLVSLAAVYLASDIAKGSNGSPNSEWGDVETKKRNSELSPISTRIEIRKLQWNVDIFVANEYHSKKAEGEGEKNWLTWQVYCRQPEGKDRWSSTWMSAVATTKFGGSQIRFFDQSPVGLELARADNGSEFLTVCDPAQSWEVLGVFAIRDDGSIDLRTTEEQLKPWRSGPGRIHGLSLSNPEE